MSVGATNPAVPAIPAAVGWRAEVMTGTAATVVAILAVAGVGLGMLAVRVDWRRGATAVVGCFVLFSARSVAMALADLARDVPSVDERPAPAPQPIPPAARGPAQPYDPYAGASVPQS